MNNLQEQNILQAKNEGLISPLIAYQLFIAEREKQRVNDILESNTKGLLKDLQHNLTTNE